MKSKFLCLALLMLAFALSFLMVSCDDEEGTVVDLTGIATQDFVADNGVYKTVVSNSELTFDTSAGLLAKIGMQQGAEYKLYSDKACTKELSEKVIQLNEGDNYIYLRVKDVSGHQRDYTFNIYRKKMLVVTYDVNGGTMEQTTIIVEEGTVLHAPQASKVGHALSWDYDFTRPITAHITIKAIWTPADRLIETDVDGIVTEYPVKYGQIAVIPTPSKAGYNFVGWKNGDASFDVTKPVDFDAEKITIVAVFEAISYNVQYILTYDGATNTKNPSSIFVSDGVVTLEPAEFDDKHIFVGWYSDINFADPVTQISAQGGKDIVLYAKWLYVSTVTLDVAGGLCSSEGFNVTYGDDYTLPVATKDGYVFLGWYDGENKVSESGKWSKDKDVTLVAKWSAKTVEIEYVLGFDGVTNSNPAKIEAITESVELVPAVLDDKHLFDGWYSDIAFTEENKVTHITADMVGAKVVLYAKWITVSSVTFNGNGGICDEETVEIAFGAEYSLPTPTNDGYKFAGWYNGDAKVDQAGIWSINGDVELVARWTSIAVEDDEINYVLGYEGVINKNPLTYSADDGVIELLPAEFDAKHIFEGWYTSADFNEDSKITQLTAVLIGNEITLYAKWTTVITVTLNADGGTCDATEININYGADYTLPTPSKFGYTFEGWYNGEAKVESVGKWNVGTDVTLVASWKLSSTEISYVIGYDGLENKNPSSFNVLSDTITLLPIEYDLKHVFIGWYTAADCAEDTLIETITTDMLGQSIVLYAKWQVISTVQFDLNGFDDALEAMDIVYGAPYTLPTLTRQYYSFGGWLNAEGKLVEAEGDAWTYGAEGVTLVAKWNAIEYGINYVLNGGAVDIDMPTKYTVLTYEGLLEALKAPTKDYAEFAGWFVDVDFTKSIDGFDLMSVEGVTLYAKWNEIKVTFNFDADGGNVSKPTDSLVLGVQYTLPTPVKEGYSFLGWYDGDKKYELSGIWTDTSVLEVNLVAKWSAPIEYTITFDLDGGKTTATLPTKYTVSDTITLPKPTKAGSYFVGWSLNGGAPNASVVIVSSTGDLTIKAVWTTLKDPKTGLLFKMIGDKQLSVVGIDIVINDSIKNGIKIPSEFDGCTVVAIESNAFKTFGEEFTKTSYANMQNSYVTISIPTTIRKVGANAFKTCNGIKVTLYDVDDTVKYPDYKTWDALTEWEDGNKAARDCVWGFRPAIGWTRYSKVEIPEGYDYLQN